MIWFSKTRLFLSWCRFAPFTRNCRHKALTEAAQSRVVQIHGAREDTDREQVVRTFGYDHMRRMNSYWYEELDIVDLDELEDSSSTTPAANIQTVLERLDNIADGAIIVNLSRGVDIPVIRAIIPMFELYTLDRERKGERIKKKRNECLNEACCIHRYQHKP